MNDPILFEFPAHWIALSIFFLILCSGWLGFKYKKFKEKQSTNEPPVAGSLESSMLGLMALLQLVDLRKLLQLRL